MISRNKTHPFLEISPRPLPWTYLADAILRGRNCLKGLGMQGSIEPEYRDEQKADGLATERLRNRPGIVESGYE